MQRCFPLWNSCSSKSTRHCGSTTREGNGDLKPDKSSSRPCFGVWKGTTCTLHLLKDRGRTGPRALWGSLRGNALQNSLQAAPVPARQWEGQQTCSQRHSAISSPSIFLLQKKIWCNTLGIIRLQKSAHLQIYCSRDWNLFPSIFSVPLPPFSSLCWR